MPIIAIELIRSFAMDSTHSDCVVFIKIRLVVFLLGIIGTFLFDTTDGIALDKVFRNLGPGINTRHDEFLPKVYRDTLYFRRNNDDNKYEVYLTEINKYFSSNPILSKFRKIKAYRNFKESSAAFDSYKYMDPSVPTFYNYTDSITDWEDPKPMAYGISSPFNDFHPAISPDGSFLVFASDRPAAVGGERQNNTDLYISFRKSDNTWTEPKNLGKKINTAQNEIAPYIAADGTLYYSSKGFRKDAAEMYFSGSNDEFSKVQLVEVKYNYDIIKAKPIIINNKVRGYQNPEKLPFPYNTEWNDIGTAMYHDSLIIASDRPSSPQWGSAYGGFDLYGWTYSVCPCDTPCNTVIVYGTVSGPGFKKLPEAYINIYGLDTLNQRTLLKSLIVDKSSHYSAELNWYCRYVVELTHVCAGSNVMYVDSVCPHNPCISKIKEKIKMPTFVIESQCQGREEATCTSCPSKCKDHIAEIMLNGKYLDLKGNAKIQIFVNGFMQTEKPVIQTGKYFFKIQQMNDLVDDIEIKYLSKVCLEPDGFLSYKYKHKCNNAANDVENISFDIPQDCPPGGCQSFIVKGKVSCSGLPVVKGKLEIISQSGLSYDTRVNGRGEYSLKIEQNYAKEKYTLTYTDDNCRQDTNFTHKCSGKDKLSYLNVNINLNGKCCADRCRSIVTIKGSIDAGSFDCSLAGILNIIDIENRKGYTVPIDESGNFAIPVPFSGKYRIEYENFCSGKRYRQYLKHESCPGNNIDDIVNFKMDKVPEQFRVDDYQIPFFVSGYWKPNTVDNLAELVKIFDKKSKSRLSCCVSDPITDFDENMNRIYYTDYCDSVKTILETAKNYILTKIRMYDCKCKKCSDNINITVIGYTDPRNIECHCIYKENDINDLGINIESGTEINNTVLSELRAYYTAKMLKSMLEKDKIYRNFADKINWTIEGAGILEDDNLPNKYRRTIDIKVECNSDESISGK